MAARAGQGLETTCAARLIKITGVVQGVGFRPHVYRLAARYGATGWVRNTTSGVEIAVEAEPDALAAFTVALQSEAPPLAQIESLAYSAIPCTQRHATFEIVGSEAEPGAYPLISPDVATCPDCLRELLDSQDRRYRYPFTNCTNCGPRFTIIHAMPYDRPSTTMGVFALCPACHAEYHDPLDRRFHAQPNACPVCGPHLTLLDAGGRPLAERDAALRQAGELLRQGAIVALKGLGGYQLACDATNAAAVARLRERKRRPHKAFAVMVADLAEAERHAHLTPTERDLLATTAAPIVLLPAREGSAIVREVAPGLGTLGIMLPYTPLHHILLRDVGRPLVMTSGNLSEEPIAQENEEALRRLRGIADYYLAHNRGIHSRYDDSVWFAPAAASGLAGAPQPLRRARGYAPSPIRLPVNTRPLLALGPELKATFCLARDGYAFLSQHIGDMQNVETFEHYAETLALYRELFDIEPELAACDMHPDYHTTRLAAGLGLPLVRVQHHHAHLAALLAEHGLDEPVIGVVWDGNGHGLDGAVWGGEFLVGDGRGFERAAHLEYLPLPGGDAATANPYRIAWAYPWALLGRDESERLGMPPAERDTLARMAASGLRTPRTSSAGRLFDAVSALVGVRRSVSYEAQAAIELEALARPDGSDASYHWGIEAQSGVQRWGQTQELVSETRVLRLAPLFADLLADLERGAPVSGMAYRLHRTLADLIAQTCAELRTVTGLEPVALTGGVFQNRLLLELVLPRLQGAGLRALTHRRVPCNDGGVALGQALVAHYHDPGRGP
jgi:hydrogenase maturation protein HypF